MADVPIYAEDGGEEAEVAGIYFIGKDGMPRRIGLAIGNEFSDHKFEKKNYLNLAGSKLRNCSLGPVLAAMSKSVIPIGPVGSGARLKLINNFVCAVQVAALAEAIAMIERSGLDRAKALELLASRRTRQPARKSGFRAHDHAGLHAEFSAASDGQGPRLRDRGGRKQSN